MKTLSVFYFSGTGNTRFVAEETGKRLAEKYEVKIYDIGEEKNCAESLLRPINSCLPFLSTVPRRPFRCAVLSMQMRSI